MTSPLPLTPYPVFTRTIGIVMIFMSECPPYKAVIQQYAYP